MDLIVMGERTQLGMAKPRKYAGTQLNPIRMG